MSTRELEKGFEMAGRTFAWNLRRTDDGWMIWALSEDGNRWDTLGK